VGNIEKPLTWVLIVVSFGLLLMENYQNLDLKFENGISTSENKAEIKDINLSQDMNLNIDSIVSAVIENIDMKIGGDTAIKIIERK
jgi:hypothetical protein|tara:strand:+ start:21 stop:278 length:258 start_codon:yes stop_codon:yes gene_type:complete